MPNDHQEQVRAFTLAVGLMGGAPESPALPSRAVFNLRSKLIEEEWSEFDQAASRLPQTVPELTNLDILVNIADAIADLLYVTYGAAVAYGIDIHPIFDIVHRANMKKIGGPKDPVTGKQLKSPGWVGPEDAIRAELERQMKIDAIS